MNTALPSLITVLGFGLLVLQPASTSAYILKVGEVDLFDEFPDGSSLGPEPTSASPEFIALTGFLQMDLDPIPGIAGQSGNRSVIHTFDDLPAAPTRIVSARLYTHIRAGDWSGTDDDGIFISFVEPGSINYPATIAWRRSFGPVAAGGLYPQADPGMFQNTPWQFGNEAMFYIDLERMPNGDGTFIDLIPLLNALRFFDVMVSDDTGVDHFSLVLGTIDGPMDEVVIDDFNAGFPPGTWETAGTGSAGFVQSGISVLGGTRELSLVSHPSFNTSASVAAGILSFDAALPEPPIFPGTIGLGYPQPAPTDLTLSSSGVPGALRAEFLQIQGSGTMSFSLEDSSGNTANHLSFLGILTPNGSPYRDVHLTAQNFPGTPGPIDFTSITRIDFSMGGFSGALSHLVEEVSSVAVGHTQVRWDDLFKFRPSVDPGPEITIHVDTLFGISGNPILDLTDPAGPEIRLTGFPPNPVIGLNLFVDPDHGVQSQPAVLGNDIYISVNNAEISTLILTIEASDGSIVDPLSIRAFNPQPEPPGREALGMLVGMTAGGAAAAAPQAAMAGPVDITLKVRLQQSGMDVPLTGEPTTLVPVPANSARGAALLALLVAAIGTMSLYRREFVPVAEGPTVASSGHGRDADHSL